MASQPAPLEIRSMSIFRPLCAAIASIIVFGALWLPGAQVLEPTTSPTAASTAATSDDDQTEDATAVPPFKPVARVSSLMTGLGSAFGQLRDVFPQTEEERRLDAIAAWSEVIAELSNVHAQHRRKPAYLARAADTRSIALDLARAARADPPEEARLATLLTKLDTSCVTCHDAEG